MFWRRNRQRLGITVKSGLPVFAKNDGTPRNLSRGAWRSALMAATSFIFLPFLIAPAHSMQIQKVVSPKGIEAWLVEDHTLPLIAMQLGFEGGSAQDPAGKDGLAYFASGMLDEGAGDIDSQAFQEKLEGLAIEILFDASRDAMTGGLKTLTKNKEEAFRLLRLALTEPRMDPDAIERIREQIFSIIKMENEDPERIAANAFFAQVYGGHPYGTPTKGSLDAIRTVTQADLKNFVKRSFARDNLHVAVVGDINAQELAAALDGIFGTLPEKAELATVPEATWRPRAVSQVIPMNMPQSVVTFGQPGLKRKDADFIPAYILNYIIGGGGFASTLMSEVREKRGLAYSVYTYLYPLQRAGMMLGGVATRNDAVKESIEIIKQELGRIAANGPTPEELEDAKRYLTGSYALRFSSSAKIADILLSLQIEGLGIDYIDKRNEMIEAVTLDDIKRVSKLIRPDELVITIVGQPQGLLPPGERTPPAIPVPRG
jgi:zinc protease